MNQPLVSIIIPAYNVERYIEDCIDSVLKQSYSHIEIIVVDDASTDATVYLLKQYKKQIHLIENETNKGQGTRRNEGIERAKGKYIYFVDSDDWIEPETIEKCVKQALKTDADLVRFNGSIFYEGSSAPLLNEGNYDFSHQLTHQEIYTGDDLLEKNRRIFSASPCLYLIKKEAIQQNNIHFLEGVLHEDEYFTTRLFYSVQKMTYLNEAFYHRRYRIASTMTEQSNKHKLKSFDSYLKVFKALEKEYMGSKLSTSQKQFLKRQMLSIYNGLVEAPIPQEHKQQLRELKTITLKDRAFLGLAKVKHRLTKNK